MTKEVESRMEQNKINIQYCKDFFAGLIENMESVFLNSNYQEQFEQFKKEYQDIAEKDKVYVVVAGNYSTGKSTIISALTGRRDIEIDSDVKTDHLQKYEFEGVCYIDTPGLESGIAEHTELANEGIKKADFILYCTTVDTLFTDTSLQDFLKILENPEYKGRVILCVNKLGSDGIKKENFPKYLQKMTEDIEDYIWQNIKDKRNAEYTITIFSAKRYIDGCDKNIEGMKNASYFGNLMDAINEITCEFNLNTEKCMKQKKVICDFLQQILDDIESHKSPAEQEKENQQRQEWIKNIQKRKEDILREVEDVFYKEERNLEKDVKEKLNEENSSFSKEEFVNLKIRYIQTGVNEIQSKINELFQELNIEYEKVLSQGSTELDANMFKKHQGKKVDGSENFFANGAHTMDKITQNIKKMGEPVAIGKRRVGLFKKEIVYSKTGGRGTELYTLLTKYFGKTGGKASYFLGETAENIAKNIAAISTAGVLLDIASGAGNSIKEYRDVRNREKIKLECIKDIQRTIDKIISEYKKQICTKVDDACKTLDKINNQKTIPDDIEVIIKNNLNELNSFEHKFINTRGE